MTDARNTNAASAVGVLTQDITNLLGGSSKRLEKAALYAIGIVTAFDPSNFLNHSVQAVGVGGVAAIIAAINHRRP